MFNRGNLYEWLGIFSAVCLVAAVLVGCFAQATDGGGEENVIERISSEVGAEGREQWLSGLVEGAFLFNPHVNNFAIDVDAEGDTVTLSGAVETKTERALAEEIALSINGVKAVNNDIVIRKQRVEAERVSDSDGINQTLTDAALTARVKTRLLANGETSGFAVNVDSQQGQVTLSGQVDSATERELIYYIAKNTKGVKGVANHIEVTNETQSISSTH